MDSNLRLLHALRIGIDAAIKHYNMQLQPPDTPATWCIAFLQKRSPSYFTPSQVFHAAHNHGQSWAATKLNGTKRVKNILDALVQSPDSGIERVPGSGTPRYFHV